MARDRAELPLFPLESVVLYPRARAPLHIFEPRYRQMMEAALAADRVIGMATVLPERSAELAGSPPLFEVGCAGFIEAWERLADGRFNLVLVGTERFRILHERLPAAGEGRLYRLAEVELLPETPPGPAEEGALRALRESVLGLMGEILERAGQEAGGLERLALLDHESFASTLCQILALPAEEKQGLLQADGPRARLETLEGLLQFHLARLRLPEGPSGTVH
jgi:uncharacterized protein